MKIRLVCAIGIIGCLVFIFGTIQWHRVDVIVTKPVSLLFGQHARLEKGLMVCSGDLSARRQFFNEEHGYDNRAHTGEVSIVDPSWIVVARWGAYCVPVQGVGAAFVKAAELYQQLIESGCINGCSEVRDNYWATQDLRSTRERCQWQSMFGIRGSGELLYSVGARPYSDWPGMVDHADKPYLCSGDGFPTEQIMRVRDLYPGEGGFVRSLPVDPNLDMTVWPQQQSTVVRMVMRVDEQRFVFYKEPMTNEPNEITVMLEADE